MKKNQDGFKTWYAVAFAFQLGFLVVILIGGFVFLGIWADKIFQTSPFLLIAGIIIGLGVTFYEVYCALVSLTKSNHD